MNNQDYINLVRDNFNNPKLLRENTLNTLVTYEEVFKWKWVATKLKIFSFINHVESVDVDIIKQYSEKCLKRAIKEKKGLPRGFQSGVVSCNILTCEHITDEAIRFVNARPKKYFSAFEYPIVYDLKNNELYYYNGEILWGMMYNQFINTYIVEHFAK